MFAKFKIMKKASTPRALVSSSDTVTEDLPVMSACCRFLVSVPECQNILSPVYALLVARTQNYSQVFGGNPLLDVGLVVNCACTGASIAWQAGHGDETE